MDVSEPTIIRKIEEEKKDFCAEMLNFPLSVQFVVKVLVTKTNITQKLIDESS